MLCCSAKVRFAAAVVWPPLRLSSHALCEALAATFARARVFIHNVCAATPPSAASCPPTELTRAAAAGRGRTRADGGFVEPTFVAALCVWKFTAACVWRQQASFGAHTESEFFFSSTSRRRRRRENSRGRLMQNEAAQSRRDERQQRRPQRKLAPLTTKELVNKRHSRAPRCLTAPLSADCAARLSQ